jgi:3-phenylpropionate/cinnamic acid dioxygenase small subunit
MSTKLNEATMTDTQSKHLQHLIDRTDIIETVYRYATGIDNKDFTLYRSIFTDDIKVDFSMYTGEEPGWTSLSADQWTEQLIGIFRGLDSTQHSMSNPIVTVDDDNATCVMYMQAEHFFKNDQGDNSYTVGGYYTDELIRTPDGWKLASVKLTVLWQRGNRHIMSLAQEKEDG